MGVDTTKAVCDASDLAAVNADLFEIMVIQRIQCQNHLAMLPFFQAHKDTGPKTAILCRPVPVFC